jgi:DNA-binding transcriptional ArsR family regulator
VFGYAPRRRLLRALFGPDEVRVATPARGFTASQLASLAGKGRDTIRRDITALERLGLIDRRRIGRRDRYFPQQGPLAAAIEQLVATIDEIAGPP